MKKNIMALSLFLLTTLHGPCLFPGNKYFDISIDAGTDMMSGYTLYGIGWNITDPAGDNFRIGYKISELSFPLDMYMAYVDHSIVFLKKWEVTIGFKKNIYSRTGMMEDSDWGYWSLLGNTWAQSSTLDIFSLSDQTINNAYSMNADFRYRFTVIPKIELSAGLGFIHEYFYFETRNLDEWYPSYDTYSANLPPEYSQHYYVSGKASTYEVKYYIPLLELEMSLAFFNSFCLRMSAGFSPLVKAFDVDDHILRSKMSRGEHRGMAFTGIVNGQFFFYRNIFAGVNVNMMFIDVSGVHNQSRYNDTAEGPAGPIGTIDTTLNSLQFQAGIYMGIVF